MNPVLRRALLWAVLCVAGAALFAAAYCQAPLYYSNQNQYFLHGLARASDGTLGEDWLANTKDPTPAFSALVEWTARLLPLAAFHVYHTLLQAIYAGSLVALFVAIVGRDVAVRRWPVFVALLFLTHAALMRWLSYRLVGFDYPWFLQAGVAGQYVLGAMLQPSVFGVLLVAGVALFALDRPLWAALALGTGAAMHATYLLPAAFLTLGFQAALLRQMRIRAALGVGLVALAVVLPTVAHSLYEFRPTDPETFARSQDILANFRIPHHTRIDRWLDPVAALQIAWVVLAVVLLRKTPLFLALAVPSALAVLLTLAQAVIQSDSLALLFPWRVSAVLVPVATGVILSRIVMLPLPALEKRLAWVVSAVVIVGLAIAGVTINATRSAFRGDDGELPVLAFVRQTDAPGDVYFLPVRLPAPSRKRGSLSSDFMPPIDRKQSDAVIPPDLQRFRLLAGAPIYVDFKSIPYKDVEVVEWRERLRIADGICKELNAGNVREAAEELRRLGVTHLVWPAEKGLRDNGLEQIHEDPVYRVYRVLR